MFYLVFFFIPASLILFLLLFIAFRIDRKQNPKLTYSQRIAGFLKRRWLLILATLAAYILIHFWYFPQAPEYRNADLGNYLMHYSLVTLMLWVWDVMAYLKKQTARRLRPPEDGAIRYDSGAPPTDNDLSDYRK